MPINLKYLRSSRVKELGEVMGGIISIEISLGEVRARKLGCTASSQAERAEA